MKDGSVLTLEMISFDNSRLIASPGVRGGVIGFTVGQKWENITSFMLMPTLDLCFVIAK